MYNTFINYAKDDEVLAKRIYADLLAAGARPWAGIYDILPGGHQEQEQQHAADTCPYMIVLLTKKYFRSEHHTRLTESAKEWGKTIIPVIADMGIKVPDGLGDGIKLKRRYGEAVRELVALLPTESDPLDEIPAWQQGNEAYHLGDFEGALEAYEGMSDESAAALHSRAAAYNALRQHDRALEDLNRALEQDATSALYYRNRSLAYGGLGQHNKALEDDKKALALEPESPENWSSYAMTLAALERFDDARSAIQKAIEYNPQNIHYLYQLGHINSRAGDLETALEAFEQVLSVEPSNNSALIGRRIALGRLGRYDDALAEVNKDIRKNPRKGSGYITRSLMNFYMERYEETVADATAALERGQEHQLSGLYNRAIAHWKLGNEEQAQDDLLKAIKLLPQLGKEQGIRNNAESDLTREPGIAILKSLQASGRLNS